MNAEASPSPAAVDVPFDEGTVWSVHFVSTKPENAMDYLRNLKKAWEPRVAEAQRQGVILSYRIMLVTLANPGAWNVVILTEVANMAALDGYASKMADIAGNIPELEAASCGVFIEDFNWRLLREVTLK